MHTKEWEDWKGLNHDIAMAEASAEMVPGDFGNVIFRYKNSKKAVPKQNAHDATEALETIINLQ